MLECVEVQTTAAPDAAIIWLHGLGADGHDFEPIVPEIVRPGERAWRFVFPHAPRRPVTINNGMSMRAWYDLQGLDRRAAEDLAGFKDTDAHLHWLIDRERERGIPSTRVVVAGFSQGGAVSLYAAPRFPEKLAGIVALSCYLPLESRLDGERVPANDATPIFLAHGRDDTVLPMNLGVQARDSLSSRGYSVEWHEYPMPHAVCAAEIADIRGFLLRVLP